MKIAIDIDKTIFECKSVIYKLLNKVEKYVPRPSKNAKIFTSDYGKDFKVQGRNFFGKLGNPAYYREIDGSIDAINNFSAEGDTVCLLSSRPNIRTMNNLVLQWLSEHKVKYNFVVVNCNNKADFCKKHGIDVLIDDGLKHCVNANKFGIDTILFDSADKVKINECKVSNPKKFHKAKSWEQIEKIVGDLRKSKSKENEVVGYSK